MMQLDLLAAPSARRFDPQTSRDAAESARELAARHHRIILDALSRGPAGKDAALADEITALRGYIASTRDMALLRKMQAKLAELIAEENRRFTDGLPF